MIETRLNTIYMSNVPGEPLLRKLIEPLECAMRDGTFWIIPKGFSWDGSSVPTWLFVWIGLLLTIIGTLAPHAWMSLIVAILIFIMGAFPKWRHPIASCKHDFRCMHAQTPKERKWADERFREDVGKTSWWITKQTGYIGVRLGAYIGVGVHY